MNIAGRSIALMIVGLLVLVGCGADPSETARNAADGAQPGLASLKVAADEFGRALLSSDAERVLEMLDPDVRSRMTAEEEAVLKTSLGLDPSKVELRKFAFEIIEEDDTSAKVTYSGERCAPQISKEFPATTVVGGPGESSESSSDGTVILGDVECSNIADAFDKIEPIEFVKVDGRWYGTFPGFN